MQILSEKIASAITPAGTATQPQCTTFFIPFYSFHGNFEVEKYFFLSRLILRAMYIGVFLVLSGFGSILSFKCRPSLSEDVTFLNKYSVSVSPTISAGCFDFKYIRK